MPVSATRRAAVALVFGQQKINVHEAGDTFEPKAKVAMPGAGDFCLVTDWPITKVQAHLDACGVAIEVGPIRRTGALGAMTSVYFRDPDGNLVEASEYEIERRPSMTAAGMPSRSRHFLQDPGE